MLEVALNRLLEYLDSKTVKRSDYNTHIEINGIGVIFHPVTLDEAKAMALFPSSRSNEYIKDVLKPFKTSKLNCKKFKYEDGIYPDDFTGFMFDMNIANDKNVDVNIYHNSALLSTVTLPIISDVSETHLLAKILLEVME